MEASIKSPSSTNHIGTKIKQQEGGSRWPRMANEQEKHRLLKKLPRSPPTEPKECGASKPGMLFLNSPFQNPLE